MVIPIFLSATWKINKELGTNPNSLPTWAMISLGPFDTED